MSFYLSRSSWKKIKNSNFLYTSNNVISEVLRLTSGASLLSLCISSRGRQSVVVHWLHFADRATHLSFMILQEILICIPSKKNWKKHLELHQILSSLSTIQALAMPPLLAPLFLLQLVVLTFVSGGAYYGHKQHPQPYQPMQHIQHIGMGKGGFPQQQYLGKDMPYMQYPHYSKELPPMPMHKGKENAHKGGSYNGGKDKGKKTVLKTYTTNFSNTYMWILNLYYRAKEWPVNRCLLSL